MKKLAVYFPGIGYHCDKPLLYYAREVACEAGFEEYINIQFDYQKENLRGDKQKMEEAEIELMSQAEQFLDGVNWAAYDEILFVSKSVGTAIAAAYARKYDVPCRNIFFTPIEQTFEQAPTNGIAFAGSRDPWVDIEVVMDGCDQAGIPLTVIEKADHSLEVENVFDDLEIIRDIMDKIQWYI